MSTGFFNWLQQVVEIALFNLRTIPARRGPAVTAAVGIAGVVAVLVGVLAISEGFQRAMTVAGSPDVAVALRSGADSELTSTLSRDEARLVLDGAGIARGPEGPLVSLRAFCHRGTAETHHSYGRKCTFPWCGSDRIRRAGERDHGARPAV